MRALRLAAPVQLRLDTGTETRGSWWDLPATTQTEVVALLSALIAKGVLDEEDGDG